MWRGSIWLLKNLKRSMLNAKTPGVGNTPGVFLSFALLAAVSAQTNKATGWSDQ
jgi:hypothetical protein